MVHLTQPTTAVIMPGRNVADVVGAQLDALGSQQGAQRWELVYVDDGSTDGSMAVVAGRGDDLPGLRVLRSPRPTNAYAARNLGLAATDARLVLCCDADDIVPPTWVAAMQAALDEHDLVGGPTRSWWPSRDKVDDVVRNTVELPHLGFLPFAIGSSFGCRRQVLEALHGWDEALSSGGDIDFSWRAQLAGHDLGGLAPEHAILYRQRSGRRAAFRQTYRQGLAQVETYRRYRDAGVARASTREALGTWATLARKLPGALRSGQLEGWCWRAGSAFGRLSGSLRTATWYP